MKNELQWLDTEYLAPDCTIQPVVIAEGTVILYTLFDNKGYNYVFGTIRELNDWYYRGEHSYIQTFETEREMIEFLETI